MENPSPNEVKKEEWEAEFDDLVVCEPGMRMTDVAVRVHVIKDRIRSLLKSDRESLRQAVERTKKNVKDLYPNVELKPTEEAAMAVEGKNRYNQALDDVLKLISDKE